MGHALWGFWWLVFPLGGAIGGGGFRALVAANERRARRRRGRRRHPQERRNAYTRARKELDGLIVLPPATLASTEQRIAGQIEA